MRRFLLVASLCFLGGCASTGMSGAECRMADWRAIGFEDGARGAAATSIASHRKACAEHGVAPHFEDYLAGHARGLESFCRPENGARLGERGYRYAGVCPVHLEGPFLDAHARTYGLYERRAALDAIRSEIAANLERSNQIEHLLVEKTARLVAPQLPAAERATLVVELKQLGEEKVALRASLHDLEHARSEAEDELASYRSQIAYRDPE